MLKGGVHADRVTSALETASVPRVAVDSLSSLEGALADTGYIRRLGDIRRAIQASAGRIDDLAEDLGRIDSQYFGTASA